MNRKFWTTTASLAFAFGLVCRANAAPVTFRVAWAASPAQMDPVVFQDKALMKHLGKTYNVKFIRMRGSSLQVTALASGSIDLAALSYSSFAQAILNAHMPVRAVMDLFQDGPDYSTTYGVLANSKIKTIADLKGKIFGVNAFGGAIDVAARAMLLKHGLKPGQDVQMLEFPFSATEPALRSGKIAIGGFTSSFWNKAESHGNVRALFHMRDIMGTSEMIFLAAREDFIKKHRAALTDFIEDYLNGLRWFRNPKNRPQALAYIAKFTKRPVKQFSGWALKGKHDYYRAANGLVNTKALQRNIDEMHSLGLIKTKLDITPYVDNSLAKAASARMK